MKPVLLALALLLLSHLPLSAQTDTPAVPADPNAPRPAIPVEPTPAPPPAPPSANSAPASTNGAPAASPVAFSLIADNSLKAVLQELLQTWADAQDNSPQVPLTLTNAATLKAKVESGAQNWDLVICADVADVKEMTERGVLSGDDQRSLARNTLVVYGRKALVKDDDLDWFDLIGTEWQKVALGNPDLTASGRVARHALQKHDLADDAHKGIYIYAATELMALGSAEREQADAVFLYKTDLAQANLPGFETLPIASDDAPPVFYIAAVTQLAKNPAQARAFMDFCTGEAAHAIWAKYGFETN